MIEQHQVEKDELNQKIRNLEEEKRALASELSNVQREKTNLVEEHAKTIEELRIEKTKRSRSFKVRMMKRTRKFKISNRLWSASKRKIVRRTCIKRLRMRSGKW